MSQIKELINSVEIVRVDGKVGISMPEKQYRLTPQETKMFADHIKQLIDEIEFTEKTDWGNMLSYMLNNNSSGKNDKK